jgi:hypothetical protein
MGVFRGGGVVGWNGIGPPGGLGVGGWRRRPQMDLRGEIGDGGVGGIQEAMGAERDVGPGGVAFLGA